jgi:hypothetical protein
MIEFSLAAEGFSETASGSRLRLGTPYGGAETTPQVSHQMRRPFWFDGLGGFEVEIFLLWKLSKFYVVFWMMAI